MVFDTGRFRGGVARGIPILQVSMHGVSCDPMKYSIGAECYLFDCLYVEPRAKCGRCFTQRMERMGTE